MAIEAGLATTVVVGYGRDNWSRVHANKENHMRASGRPQQMYGVEFGPEIGLFGAVAAHAFGAQRHMHEFEPPESNSGKLLSLFVTMRLEILKPL